MKKKINYFSWLCIFSIAFTKDSYAALPSMKPPPEARGKSRRIKPMPPPKETQQTPRKPLLNPEIPPESFSPPSKQEKTPPEYNGKPLAFRPAPQQGKPPPEHRRPPLEFWNPNFRQDLPARYGGEPLASRPAPSKQGNPSKRKGPRLMEGFPLNPEQFAQTQETPPLEPEEFSGFPEFQPLPSRLKEKSGRMTQMQNSKKNQWKELSEPRKMLQEDILPPGLKKDPMTGQVYRMFTGENGQTYVEEYHDYGTFIWEMTWANGPIAFGGKNAAQPMIEKVEKLKRFIRKRNLQGIRSILIGFRKFGDDNDSSDPRPEAEDLIDADPSLLLYALATYGQRDHDILETTSSLSLVQLSEDLEKSEPEPKIKPAKPKTKPEESEKIIMKAIIKELKNFGYRKKYSLFI
ncbi:MAG: hypothetical protein LBR92_01110 [Puniceicoccales bacterium]|jgi:hypothetical protein|nr:hypothetical protein [Puniceicoccales bacterium]